MQSEFGCTFVALFRAVRKARYFVFPNVKNTRCAFLVRQLDRYDVAAAAALIAISPSGQERHFRRQLGTSVLPLTVAT